MEREPHKREASANTHLLEIFAESLLEKLSIFVENSKEQLVETINRIPPTLSLFISIFATLMSSWW
jgi:hypothetical protein